MPACDFDRGPSGLRYLLVVMARPCMSRVGFNVLVAIFVKGRKKGQIVLPSSCVLLSSLSFVAVVFQSYPDEHVHQHPSSSFYSPARLVRRSIPVGHRSATSDRPSDPAWINMRSAALVCARIIFPPAAERTGKYVFLFSLAKILLSFSDFYIAQQNRVN
ncbi:hypothetical protein NL676_032735 [Syzygium grande]|nr:hypothetical protein NL676_032735 [Syzygium grande]